MSSKSKETQDRFAAIVETLAGDDGVSLGSRGKKGFGAATLQVHGKIFAMISPADRFVVKLPKARVEALEAAGDGQKFDPGHGRLMKEWLALHPTSGEDWLALARESLGFVRGKA